MKCEGRLECGGRVVVPRLWRAEGFAGRALGLMGRRDLPVGEALRLAPCGAIHTGFLRFPIDALFLSRDGVIVRFARGIRPWRGCAGGRGAVAVVEARAGWIDPAAVPVGARVRIVPVNAGDGAVRAR